MNGISHKQAIQWIHRRLDGLLSESQLSSLEEHLRFCDSCRAYAFEMDSFSAHLQNEFHRRWDETSGPSQTVMEHVTAKAKRIPITNRISSGSKLLAGSLALIILAVFINFVVSRLQSASQMGNVTDTVDNTARAENRLLAFTSVQNGNADIYTIHVDGSGLTNITNDPGYDSNPFWSPDGKRIAFERDQDGFKQIYLMDADGSNLVRLTNDEAHHYLPSNIDGISNPWSSDGSKLLFLQSEPEEETSTLYSIDIDGGNTVTFASGNFSHSGLSWSPNGNYIGYVRNESLTPDAIFEPNIYIADAAASNVISVNELIPQNESINNPFYSWSRDGNSIIFTARRHLDEGRDQWIAYEASLVDAQLTERATSSGHMEDWWEGTSFIRGLSALTLTWLRADGTFNTLEPLEICQSAVDSQHGFVAKRSPNGNQIVNVLCPNDEMRFYYVNSDATIIKPLLDSPISAFAVENGMTNMIWSPDDRFVAITLVSPDKSSMYILNVQDNSKSEEIVLSDSELYTVPSWQPITEENLAKDIPTPQPESTPNGLLAFTSDQNGNYDIYTMQGDGNRLTNITNHPADDTYPFWSPDGQRIAFTSNRNGSMQIYLMDADGSNVIQLTSGEGRYSFDINGPAPWSPDGRKLIFGHKSPEEENGRLYVIDIYEKTITSLTNEPGLYLTPSWSPNGNHIAFTAITSQTREDIFIVGSDGMQSIKVTENLPRGEFVMPDYHWSRDGENLSFIVARGTYSVAYTASLDGSLNVIHRTEENTLILDWWNETALLDNPLGTLTWLNSDGSEYTLDHCTNSQLVGTPHKWSDGGNLILASNCSSGEWMLYWANPDGTEIDQLLDSPLPINEDDLFNLSWSLDEQYVAFVGMDTMTLYVLDVAKAREDPSIQPLIMENSAGHSWQPISNQEVVQEQSTPTPTQTVNSEVLPPITTGIENGEWIAFISGNVVPDPAERAALTINQDVYKVRPDGSGLVKLTNFPTNYFDLQWSPDGQHLLFLMENPSSDKINFVRHYVGVAESHGEVTRPIIDPDHYGYSWSPNNGKIVFADASSGNYDIYTVYTDGRNDPKLTQLTDDPAQDVGFAWSPDGSQIAFQRLNRDELSVYVMNEDGSDQREVARGTGQVKLLWSQDGTSIYASSIENSRLACEGCITKPGIYRIDLNGPLVYQIHYEENSDQVAGWYLYDTPQDKLYFMRINHPNFVEFWGTWFRADGNSVIEIGEMDPHQTCKTTTGNILNESISPNPRFSVISNFCAGGFNLYLADHEATPEERFIHLLQLPLDTEGQGGDFATLPIGWSPDGRWLIYDNGRGMIYLLDIERAIQDPEAALTLLIEPILYTGADGQLYQSSETISVFDLVWQPVP